MLFEAYTFLNVELRFFYKYSVDVVKKKVNGEKEVHLARLERSIDF